MTDIKIGNKFLGETHPCIISLEPGATFTNIEEAKEMIRFSADAGADAIKFQTFLPGDADRIMGKKDIKIDFTTAEGKKEELVYDALKRRELTSDEWKELVLYSKSNDLLFITAPYFPETVDLLQEIQVDAIKVSKGDVNNVLLIEKIAKTNLPVIIDAREKFDDVMKDIQICENNQNNQIIIMHCPSGYPAKHSDVNLMALQGIKEHYDYPVGFADHSEGTTMNYAAIALGAKMIEKTITIDKSIQQVEHYMSLELNELKTFVNNVRSVEDALGTSNVLQTSRVNESARRSLVAKRNISKGEKISSELLDYRRPENMGISVSKGFEVLNKIALQDIPQGTPLKFEMLGDY